MRSFIIGLLTTLRIVLFLRLLAPVVPFVLTPHLVVRHGARAVRQATESKDDNDNEYVGDDVWIHHTAIRTRNITTAIDFYSLLGFELDCRFRAGPARAAWLTLRNVTTSAAATARLEIIEVPAFILQEPPGMRRRAPDLMENAQELGYNHMALDVTAQIQNDDSSLPNLDAWIQQLDQRSLERFGRRLRVAVPPRQQLIGQSVYELAFIYDADGSLVEFLHKQGQVSQDIESGWDPWDGQGFVGQST